LEPLTEKIYRKTGYCAPATGFCTIALMKALFTLLHYLAMIGIAHAYDTLEANDRDDYAPPSEKWHKRKVTIPEKCDSDDLQKDMICNLLSGKSNPPNAVFLEPCATIARWFPPYSTVAVTSGKYMTA
jgi:hypothetical protein